MKYVFVLLILAALASCVLVACVDSQLVLPASDVRVLAVGFMACFLMLSYYLLT